MPKRLNIFTLLLFFCLTLLFLSCIFSDISSAEIRFSITEHEIALDQNLAIPVNLVENDPNGFRSWTIHVNYDPNILNYLSLNDNTLLLKDYFSVNAYEYQPGTIAIFGAVSVDSQQGEKPTKGTGTFLYLNFSAKRQYPMTKATSMISLAFPWGPPWGLVNNLKNAISENGLIKIKPDLNIYNVKPATSIINENVTLTIKGQGFDPNTFIVVGFLKNLNINYIDNNTISAVIPANSLYSGLYYDVIVSNPGGYFGLLENGFGIEHQFYNSMILFGYPSIPPEECDSSFELISYFNSLEERVRCIKSFDPQASEWLNTYWYNNSPSGDNFQISNINSNLMYLSSYPFVKSFKGTWEFLDSETLFSRIKENTHNGLNLISIPPVSIDLGNSYSIIANISGSVLTRLNTKNSSWESTYKFFNRTRGPAFPIEYLNGYCLYK